MAESSVSASVKLSGVIERYRATRGEACFVFAESDKASFGMVAIAAGLAGMGGQAMAMAGQASSLEESADHLEFELAGEVVKGWVWRSPFQDGDQVVVVGQRQGSHIEIAGIARPSDRTIALYPHCSRGVSSHCLNAFKWWIVGTALFIGAALLLEYLAAGRPSNHWDRFGGPFDLVSLSVAAFTAIMTISLARKWMPFARVAERVFRELGLPKPSMVDLVRSSKAQRRAADPGEFGTFYFRY